MDSGDGVTLSGGRIRPVFLAIVDARQWRDLLVGSSGHGDAGLGLGNEKPLALHISKLSWRPLFLV